MYRYPKNGTKHTHTYGDVLQGSKTETPPTNVRTNDHYPFSSRHSTSSSAQDSTDYIVRSIGTTTPRV